MSISRNTSTSQNEELEEITDWGAYLMEGIPKWNPPSDTDSSDWDDTESEDAAVQPSEISKGIVLHSEMANLEQSSDESINIPNEAMLRNELAKHVQHNWFTFGGGSMRMIPPSIHYEARVALHWEEALNKMVMGIIPTDRSNILPENLVLREIIWQMYSMHNGYCFKYEGNTLVVNADVTISSVTHDQFHDFLRQFLTYIELMDIVQKLCKSLYEKETPETYKSYACVVETIISPVLYELGCLQAKIAFHDDTMTLLKLSSEIRRLIKPLKLLKIISDQVLVDHKLFSARFCVTNLLTKLHNGIYESTAKTERDLYLTLYLGSLYAYINLIDNWLTRGKFSADVKEEFIITDKTEYRQQNCNIQVKLDDVSAESRCDGFLRTIYERLPVLAENMNILKVLLRLHEDHEATGKKPGTMYEELVERFLLEITEFSGNINDLDVYQLADKDEQDLDDTTNDFDKLENLVDTDDYLMMRAFESYLKPAEDNAFPKQHHTLYQRIRSSTIALRGHDLFETVFSILLKERFEHCGLTVRRILLEDHYFEEHFEIIQRIYLFKDDHISSFYHRIFNKLEKGESWRNPVHLMWNLQETLMDAFPKVHQNIRVTVNNEIKTDDLLIANQSVNIYYNAEWPLNIIIKEDHLEKYQVIFWFLLKLKWMQHVLVSLFFSERQKNNTPQSFLKKQLNRLRFNLLHTVYNMQNFVFGYLIPLYLKNFRSDLDNSYDICSLTDAHVRFISSIYKGCHYLQKCEGATGGFSMLLNTVHNLSIMWKNPKFRDHDQLIKMMELYKQCADELQWASQEVQFHHHTLLTA